MSDGDRAWRAWPTWPASAHDALTHASFVGAMLCLAVIVVAYCYEVVARYFFNAPTSWAGALVSYALCGVVFLATPELTRRNIHIVINVLLDRMRPRHVAHLQRVIIVACAVACLFAAWIVGTTAVTQYRQDIQTILNWPVPKWPMTAVIAYGLGSAGLYFLRHLVSGGDRHASAAGIS